MQAQLEALQGASSSQEPFEKKDPKAAASKSKVQPPPGKSLPETDAAKDARLRRLCEKKPSGRLQVPEEMHLKWKSASREERDDMIALLEQVGWNKDQSISNDHYMLIFLSFQTINYSILDSYPMAPLRGAVCVPGYEISDQDQQVVKEEAQGMAHGGDNVDHAEMV